MGVTRTLRVTCDYCDASSDHDDASFLGVVQWLEDEAWAVNLRAGLERGTTVCPTCVKSLWEPEEVDHDEDE